ncbi:hypothetical protein C0Q70_11449 [Pomacea canaliculata]|uniref:Uncharacterized protein n=1 Tax=Pomacea canaliculata TaxID=400727 RepID=A0A2T7P600_POMCA|nr:hypothetical protein C0Q70_11449 [Pomacea canaliculata]
MSVNNKSPPGSHFQTPVSSSVPRLRPGSFLPAAPDCLGAQGLTSAPSTPPAPHLWNHTHRYSPTGLLSCDHNAPKCRGDGGMSVRETPKHRRRERKHSDGYAEDTNRGRFAVYKDKQTADSLSSDESLGISTPLPPHSSPPIIACSSLLPGSHARCLSSPCYGASSSARTDNLAVPARPHALAAKTVGGEVREALRIHHPHALQGEITYRLQRWTSG